MTRAALRRALVAAVVILTLASVADAKPWGWLGVRIRDLSEQEMEELAMRHGIREGFGVAIVEVMEGTPASKAGMRAGDIVVAFEGRPVTETRLLQRLVAAAPMDRDARLTVLRREGRRQLNVRLAAMPTDVAGDRVAAEFGFALRSEGPSDLQAAVPGEAAPAVAVVLRGGVAERAGLQIGDVLLQIGDVPVVSREAARRALADVSLERDLRLTVRRGEERVSLQLPAP
jgi:serine protease Do